MGIEAYDDLPSEGTPLREKNSGGTRDTFIEAAKVDTCLYYANWT